MEANRRTWEEPWMFREDVPEFAGGGADEFLSGEEERGERYPGVFIR